METTIKYIGSSMSHAHSPVRLAKLLGPSVEDCKTL